MTFTGLLAYRDCRLSERFETRAIELRECSLNSSVSTRELELHYLLNTGSRDAKFFSDIPDCVSVLSPPQNLLFSSG